MYVVFQCSGYMIEGGISRQVYGGNRVTEGLNNHLLSDNKFRFFTDVEFNIVRSLMEKVSAGKTE